MRGQFFEYAQIVDIEQIKSYFLGSSLLYHVKNRF